MWEALVAVGTLGLGGATFWLGWYTRKLARTSAAELQAQWRPIVLPRLAGLSAAQPNEIAYAGGQLQVPVRNAGRGPAIFLRTELDPAGNASAEHGAIAAMAAGDERRLTWTGVKEEAHVQLLLDYRDLAGRAYSTSLTLDLQNGRFYDVRFFEASITHHGDSVYPQPGLRDAAPKSRPALRARTSEAVRVLRGKRQI